MSNSQNHYEDPSRKDWVLGIIVIIVYVVLISVTAFWLLPDDWLIWLMIVIGGTLLIVNWHTKSYAFRCRSCKHEFEISFLKNFFSPHGIDKIGAWHYLKCPNCKVRSKVTVIKIVKSEENE